MNAPTAPDALFRAQHVGASEVTALFGCNPWLTEFELWHRKKGNIAVPEFNAIADDGTPDNERIYWGVKLEAAIIEAAKERFGYVDHPPADPPLSNGKGLGGHPDRRVICPERGRGILETKMVDWLVRKSWGDEPPMHYLVQGNTYAGLDQVDWFDILVLVGGNKLERFKYEFRPKLFAEAEKRVEAFWRSVHENRPPKPDYTRDGEAIGELNRDSDGSVLDLRGDNLAMSAAMEWLTADAECKAAAERRDAARAELMDKLGAAEVGLLDGITIKAPTVKATPDTIITEKMVGQPLKGRRAYRRFSIKEKA
jgi:predicted phage-related endonuclease